MRPTIQAEPLNQRWGKSHIFGGTPPAGAEPPLGSEGFPTMLLDVNDAGAPGVLSLLLGRQSKMPEDPTALNELNADVRARVSFGVGGLRQEFDCDWSAGTCLTLPSTALRISAVPFAPIAGRPYASVYRDPVTNEPLAWERLQLLATIGQGTRSGGVPPIYTQQVILTPGSAWGAPVPVPQFARHFWVNACLIGKSAGLNVYDSLCVLQQDFAGNDTYVAEANPNLPVQVRSGTDRVLFGNGWRPPIATTVRITIIWAIVL